MSRARSFFRFWYGFLVGDDWRLSAGIVLALAMTELVETTVSAWWLLPLAVAALLGSSVARAAHRSG